MAVSKTTYKWIFGIVAAIVIIGVIYYLYSSGKNNKTAPKGKKGTKPTPKPVTPGTIWKEESFPLNVGMRGPYTQQLQAALGINQDQEFGTKTADAVRARGGSVPLSESDYNLIALVGQTVGAYTDGILLINSDFSGNPAQVKEGDILGTIQNVVDPTTPALQAGLLGGSYLIDTSTSNPPISGNVYVQKSDVFFTDLK